MQNRNLILGGIVLLVVAVVGGLWAYNFVLGDTLAPSGPITAVPITTNTSLPATETLTQVGESIATLAVVTAPTADDSTGTGPVIFQIISDQSETRFSIFEELAGQPNTVVGATDQVAGEVAVDLSDLSKTQVGVIQINARTFVTDNDRRNRAIRNFILNTDQYEFITFTPIQIIGLSGSAEPGQPFSFQIAGNLTIRDITQPIVFEVTVTGESPTRITGTAMTIVKRGDYNLTIPSVPSVANVGEDITLEFDFAAEAASS